MLKQTFIHIPGIGPKMEQLLWSRGFANWDAVPRKSSESKLPPRLGDQVTKYIELSREALGRRDIDFFARTLPTSQRWRLYEEFAHDFVFLDIETTGLSRYYDEVTLTGLFDGHEYRLFLRDHSLADLPRALEHAKGVVTFNGSLFDLPFLRQTFPDIQIPSVHIDLRFLLKRLGIRGRLKAIEASLGIQRPETVEDLGGYEATVLWHRYCRGDYSALERLVEYNYFDVVNLKVLLDLSVATLKVSLSGQRSEARRDRNHPHPQPWAAMMSRTGPFDPSSVLPLESRDVQHQAVSYDIGNLLALLSESQPRVVGIDLAVARGKRSGWAVLDGASVQTATYETDQELVEATVRQRPELVSIDAPLSRPRRRPDIMRECERVLKRRGLNVYPCLLPSMSPLTDRGIILRRIFERLGIDVIESYPGAAQDIMRIPRKKASLTDMRKSLAHMGFEGSPIDDNTTHDELDAITSALVGYFHLADKTEPLGEPQGHLFVPEKGANALLSNGLRPAVDAH